MVLASFRLNEALFRLLRRFFSELSWLLLELLSSLLVESSDSLLLSLLSLLLLLLFLFFLFFSLLRCFPRFALDEEVRAEEWWF